MGGLTVLRALRAHLPNESFLYLGDTARLPYGTKSAATVQRYALQASRVLADHGIKALVVACNTASAVALPALAEAYAPLPVFGVVEPGAAAASRVHGARHRGVAVLATESTVRGGAYQSALHRSGVLKVWARPAPLLVTLAEEGRLDGALTEHILRVYLEALLARDPAAVLLGCTHFPIFQAVAEKLAGSGVRVVDSAQTTARAVAAVIERTTLAEPNLQFLATDDVTRFTRVGETFLGEALSAVELVDLN